MKTPRKAEPAQTEKDRQKKIRQKIDSRLLQAINERREKNKPAKSGLEPVNVNADKNGNLNVDIKAEVTESLIRKITSLGGTIDFASKEYHSIRAAINLSVVEKIAACAEVKFIEPAAMAQLNRLGGTGKMQPPGTDTLHDH